MGLPVTVRLSWVGVVAARLYESKPFSDESVLTVKFCAQPAAAGADQVVLPDGVLPAMAERLIVLVPAARHCR